MQCHIFPNNNKFYVNQSGIIIGPTGLGRNKKFYETLFSPKGLMVLDVYESLGMILFSFLIGLRTDLNVVKRAGGLSLATGVTTSILPLVINVFGLFALKKTAEVEDKDYNSLKAVAGLEALINFNVVFTILTDQKLVNTDLGRIALSSSMISGICNWVLIIVLRSVHDAAEGKVVLTLLTPLCRLVLILFTIYAVRPVMFWMIRRTPEEKTLKQSYVCIITLLVFGVALYSDMNGIHPVFASILLGLAVPDGSSLQSGLVDKLEGFISGVLLPSFIVNVGRRVDLRRIRSLRTFGHVQLFVVLGFLGKLLGTMLPSTFWNIPLMDAFLIGLLLSCQGIFDIQFFSIAERSEVSMYVVLIIQGAFHFLIQIFGP